MSSNMERRLILHEKLQGLKQKKMSIKQGDVLVTLNLRTDLANPSIDIAEKALFMLESFVDKNTEKARQDSDLTLARSGKLQPPPTASLCVDTINASTSKSNFRSKDKLLISPSKRVRFVLDKSVSSENVQDLASSQETNLDISNSSGIVQDGTFFSVLSF